MVYILTPNSMNDDVFNLMESESFYNYGGSFIFSQVI